MKKTPRIYLEKTQKKTDIQNVEKMSKSNSKCTLPILEHKN